MSTSVLASNTPSMCTSVGLIDSIIPTHCHAVLAPLVLTGIMVSERGELTHPCLVKLSSSLVVSLLWTSLTESPVNLFFDSGLLDSPGNYDTPII